MKATKMNAYSVGPIQSIWLLKTSFVMQQKIVSLLQNFICSLFPKGT